MTIEPRDLLEENLKVEAMVLAKAYMNRELKVVVDTTIMNARNPARYHMALAEEIGHIQLHRAVMLDISECEDFVGLQAHPRWKIAERDAKYYGRALLMPQRMLEGVVKEKYEALASDRGFRDFFQFLSLLEAHVAVVFQVQVAEVRRRFDEYFGGLRARIEKSFAVRNTSLFEIADDVREELVVPDGLTEEQLYGATIARLLNKPKESSRSSQPDLPW
jgi:hypothetical protein